MSSPSSVLAAEDVWLTIMKLTAAASAQHGPEHLHQYPRKSLLVHCRSTQDGALDTILQGLDSCMPCPCLR